MDTETKPTKPAAKPILKSKTLAVNAVIIAASFFPTVADWVSGNPDDTLAILAAVNIVLRLVTKGRVAIFPGR